MSYLDINMVRRILYLIISYECPLKKYFGIDCAGCGVMRMVISIINLDFYQAFRYNMLFFLLLMFLMVYLFYVVVCKVRGVSFYKVSYKVGIVIWVLIIGFGILRNIKGFEFLKPIVIS